jgi:hypothetical protein
MSTAVEIPTPRLGLYRPRPRMTRGGDWVTLALSVWLLGGIFTDAWAHVNLANLETFFTPWHAVLYSGLAVNTVWFGRTLRKNAQRGAPLRNSVPIGYGTAIVGLLLVFVGGIADLIWHTILGIEADFEALLSPTHLTFFIGALLVAVTPLRSEWIGRSVVSPSLRELGPAVLSATLLAVFSAAAFAYFSPFHQEWIGSRWMIGVEQGHPSSARLIIYMARASGVGAILFYNLLLFAPVLMLIRRWRLPIGALTILLGVTVASTLITMEFRYFPFIFVGLVGGLAADVLALLLKPGGDRIWATRAFAFVAPIVLWSIYVAAALLSIGVGWPVELWSGSILWAGILGFGLSVLIFQGGSGGVAAPYGTDPGTPEAAIPPDIEGGSGVEGLEGSRVPR